MEQHINLAFGMTLIMIAYLAYQDKKDDLNLSTPLSFKFKENAVKPGWKTSECWHAVLTQVVAFVTLMGIISKTDADGLGVAIGDIITAVFVILTNAGIVATYMQTRFRLKVPGTTNGDTVMKGIIGAIVSLLLIGSSASAQCPCTPGACKTCPPICQCQPGECAKPEAWIPQDNQVAQFLPWRANINQQLKQQDDAIRQLQNKPASPATPQAQPAPQLIYLQPPNPPLQSYPIQGQPKQDFPIQGDPKQVLPIQGQPQQNFPIIGQPQQQMPIQGQPIQQMPIQGSPQPLPQGPQTYSRQYAIHS